MNASEYVLKKHEHITSMLCIDIIPHPSVWRDILPWWPNALRQLFATKSESYQNEGMSWQEAEWRSFFFFAADTLRFARENPGKEIPFHVPYRSFDSDLSEEILAKYSIVADQWFLKELNLYVKKKPEDPVKSTSSKRGRKKKPDPSMGILFHT